MTTKSPDGARLERQLIVVIDYDGGNLASAARAATRAAEMVGVDAEVVISNDPGAVRRASRIVLPGQGAFADCARGLAAVPGLRASIEDAVDGGSPFLGICVGMQLMAERGLEHGATQGLGWIGGEIAPMEAPGLRLPQMGWNELTLTRPHPLTEGLGLAPHGYFVHSYALTGAGPGDLLATTDYGGAVPAIVAHGNRAGTQFHVEKSQDVGLKIMANFLLWEPSRGSEGVEA
ncbi:imidazole glycerol phosphate synthase subunit HisH [Acetobacter nitrogenifigens DSM 23921 = NBRC 105050]|uniref:Imidazole glycerol phosphate synthase subunit HisH n=1 Tax=Acetobacter nitrogenifigens DSM 23921 = NBRC 105050 TaxID=1120919 RepID=A0A511XCS3_9PROT|nr:imidazole glycerol phosphate synthase subunit HisH [Acetobacter nitrogenifigens]GBQ91803.1 imidazole glycerol phosphate synthase subunit HisH [Acetobacter nitrogenifigens DSM 23921 = NBRC 105050]GEN60766.1 imidazole glycerol phosphate synthase subunit HisH [Acetobacter nitrogenifigens DSM 23921 = NBRC 105050]